MIEGTIHREKAAAAGERTAGSIDARERESREWLKNLRWFLHTFLYFIMTVQIVLGVLWMGKTMVSTFTGGLSDWHFAETDRLLQASTDWILDEYTGVLYPAILAAARSIFPSGIAFEGVVQLLQVVVSFLACLALLHACSLQGKASVCGALYLATIPFNALFHMSLLPQSLLGSLLVLSMAVAVRLFRSRATARFSVAGESKNGQENERQEAGQKDGQGKEQEDEQENGKENGIVLLAGSLICWSLMILLEPDYWWLDLPLVLFAVVCFLGKAGKKTIVQTDEGQCGRKAAGFVRTSCVCLAFLLAATLPVGANRLVQTQGSGGRIQKSFASCMVSRMVWPDFGQDYFLWPEEIQALFTAEELAALNRADQVAEEFGPRVEAAYGRKKARELYLEMAVRCFGLRTKEKLVEIGQDFLAYLATPWCVWEQLAGRWEQISCSGWNDRMMTAAAPKLAKWYVRAGYFGVSAGLAASLLLKVLDRKKKNSRPGAGKTGLSRSLPLMILVLVCVVWQAAWYTMSGAGMMDYGKVPGIFLFWYCWIPLSFLTHPVGRNGQRTKSCKKTIPAKFPGRLLRQNRSVWYTLERQNGLPE